VAAETAAAAVQVATMLAPLNAERIELGRRARLLRSQLVSDYRVDPFVSRRRRQDRRLLAEYWGRLLG